MRVLDADGHAVAGWWHLRADLHSTIDQRISWSTNDWWPTDGVVHVGGTALARGRVIFSIRPGRDGRNWAPIELECADGAFATSLPLANVIDYRVVWSDVSGQHEHVGVIEANTDASMVEIYVPTGQLRVQVSDANNLPARRMIRLLRVMADGGLLLVREANDAMVSDVLGVVQLDNLPSGNYVVECSPRNELERAARSSVVAVTDGALATTTLLVVQ